MQRLGFIHDMMDVKVLILVVMTRVKYPVTVQQIYELCFQDDCLSYFDVCAAIPEMVTSGHLAQDGETYTITEKGRESELIMASSVAYSVRCRAEEAVMRFNRRMRNCSMVKTQLRTDDTGETYLEMQLHDDTGVLLKLALPAPDEREVHALENAMQDKAELIYSLVMTALLDDEADE